MNTAMQVKDYLGENLLFVCARSGDVEMLKWFHNGSDVYYKARG